MNAESIAKPISTNLRSVASENAARLLFSLSLVVNLAFVAFRQNFYSVTTWENGEIARNLIMGLGYSSSYLTGTTHVTSVMAPVYVFFLTGVYEVFGITPTAYVFVQVLQAVVQAGSIVVLYLIGKRLFGHWIGFLGGGLMALYPDYIYSVTVIHQLVFTTFLILLLVYSLLWFRDDATNRRAVVVGSVLGVTILTFPMALIFSPFVALWIFLQVQGRSRLTALRLVTVVTLTTIAFVAPWAIRNTLVHDRFVLMKLVGWNFWRGNAPPAIHTGVPNDFHHISPALDARISTMSEARADAVFFERATEYVLAHPVVFAEKVVSSMWYFWWFPPVLDVHEYQVGLLRSLAYLPVFVAGALGIALTGVRRGGVMLIYFLFVAFTGGYSLFFVLSRYKVPTVQPFLILFAAIGVYWLYRKGRHVARNRSNSRAADDPAT